MPLMRSEPNFYQRDLSLVSTSSGEGFCDFGFPASTIRLLNTCSDDAWVRFGSSETYATCTDMMVRACSEVVLPVPPCSSLFAYSTGTTKLRVTALGG